MIGYLGLMEGAIESDGMSYDLGDLSVGRSLIDESLLRVKLSKMLVVNESVLIVVVLEATVNKIAIDLPQNSVVVMNSVAVDRLVAPER